MHCATCLFRDQSKRLGSTGIYLGWWASKIAHVPKNHSHVTGATVVLQPMITANCWAADQPKVGASLLDIMYSGKTMLKCRQLVSHISVHLHCRYVLQTGKSLWLICDQNITLAQTLLSWGQGWCGVPYIAGDTLPYHSMPCNNVRISE